VDYPNFVWINVVEFHSTLVYVVAQLLCLTAKVNQDRGASPPDFLIKSRPRRTARPIKNVHVKLPARYPYLALKTAVGLRPWMLQDAPNGVSVLMLSRQTLVNFCHFGVVCDLLKNK